jgi:hypothetical protein
MRLLRIPLLFMFGLITVATASVAAQPALDYMNEPFAVHLRTAVQEKYPLAKVTIAGRHTAEPFQVRLTVINITPPKIMGRPLAASYSTSEEIARTFLHQFSRQLELDADILEVTNVRQFDYGKRGIVHRVTFRPCIRGVPVVRSTIDVEVGEEHVSVNCHNPLPVADICMENPIPADSAVASVEWAERKRYFSSEQRRPVRGYSIIDGLLFDDFFDVKASSGRWIPFEERCMGNELVIFPQVVDEQVIPKFAWRMYLGLGEVGYGIPYVEAIVDARSGEVLNLNSLGGGCVIVPWIPTACSKQ